MVKCLRMDGIDDCITLPQIMYNRLIFDVAIDNSNPNENYYLISSEGGRYLNGNSVATSYSHIERSSMTIFKNGYSGISIDGGPVVSSSVLESNKRHIITVTCDPLSDSSTEIFCGNNKIPGTFTKGIIYGIELYANTTLVSKYDMSKGTVQDQSVNGFHPTLWGGTWIDDEEDLPPQAYPPVDTIISIDKIKLGRLAGVNASTVRFKFDQDIVEWQIRALGTSHDTGTLVANGGPVPKGNEIATVIYNSSLYKEGENRFNIYGKNSSGLWTVFS